MMVQKSIINKSVIFILLLAALSSCIDEIHTHGIDVSSISVRGMELMNTTHPGEADDNVVRSLRILSLNVQQVILLLIFVIMHGWVISFIMRFLREATILCFW